MPNHFFLESLASRLSRLMEQPTDQKPPPTIQPLKLAEVSEPAVKGQTPRSRSRAGHSRETGISPRNSISLYNTFNEAELSEYLVYITCPICEEVHQMNLPSATSPLASLK